MDFVLKEIELSQKGITDTELAESIGSMLPVDVLLVGSISEVGQYFHIDIRLVDVKEAVVLAAASRKIEIRKSNLIIEMGTEMAKNPRQKIQER